MTTDHKPKDNPESSQGPVLDVAAAVRAMLAARKEFAGTSPVLARAPEVTVIGSDGSTTTVRRAASKPQRRIGPDAPTTAAPYAPRPVSTSEGLLAAQEAALVGFPEDVKVAARAELDQILLRIAGKSPPKVFSRPVTRPWPLPSNLPHRRPEVVVPPFPAAGFDDPDVRAEWHNAHHLAAEARYMLETPILTAYANAQLACEQWDANERGRKPSGDLRHPVPRDRLARITAEMTAKHAKSLARAESSVVAIESGDVVGVKVDDGFEMPEEDYFDSEGKQRRRRPYLDDLRLVTLILQSDLDRNDDLQRARANRSPEEVEAEKAAWEREVERMIQNMPPDPTPVEVPNMPDLPTHRLPNKAELWAVSNAILKHTRYLEKGAKIEAKRQKDAETKVRTNAKHEAQQADPEGTAAAARAAKLAKAAERQRRWRERQAASKGTPS